MVLGKKVVIFDWEWQRRAEYPLLLTDDLHEISSLIGLLQAARKFENDIC